jgi:hypothetical protein
MLLSPVAADRPARRSRGRAPLDIVARVIETALLRLFACLLAVRARAGVRRFGRAVAGAAGRCGPGARRRPLNFLERGGVMIDLLDRPARWWEGRPRKAVPRAPPTWR